MNKIRFIADKDTNYVFHMLSVAECGYDNAYGRSWRKCYPPEDLAVIKEQEQLLTVRGGEHCGALYRLMVAEPACGKMPAKEYYAELIRRVDCGDVPESFQEDTSVVRRISAVMVKHYDHYIENIWPGEKEKIEAYIPQVLALFEKSNFTDRAEKLVGCKLLSEYFSATLVTSVQNGAEAIDISGEQDVFGILRSPRDSFYFIGHEFIIYLLLNALKDQDAFQHFATWNLTEGLAEYYLKKIEGDSGFFESQKRYVEFYEKCEENGKLSAAELYRMGLQAGQHSVTEV